MSAHVLLTLLNELGKNIKCDACRALYPFKQVGSYISVPVSLNLLNELGKSDIVFVCFFVIFFKTKILHECSCIFELIKWVISIVNTYR